MADETANKELAAPQASQSQKAQDAPSEDAEAVTLYADSLPFNFVDFRVPQEDGTMLVFDKHGTEVAAEDADSLTELALQHGVALTRKDA